LRPPEPHPHADAGQAPGVRVKLEMIS